MGLRDRVIITEREFIWRQLRGPSPCRRHELVVGNVGSEHAGKGVRVRGSKLIGDTGLDFRARCCLDEHLDGILHKTVDPAQDAAGVLARVTKFNLALSAGARSRSAGRKQCKHLLVGPVERV